VLVVPERVSDQRVPRGHRWSIVVLLLVVFALRVPGLNGPRFHPDEALFASFARAIAVWRDPLLAAAPVDKPPLLFYLQALCYPFLGPREMAARLPNLYASLVSVALTYAIAKRLLGCTRPLSPLFAALLAGLSPLAVAFGATAFTDPLMVMWALAALLAAARGRPGYAGLWLGLGMATKYQAALFLPLAVGLLWWQGRGRMGPTPGDRSSGWLLWIRFLLGMGAPVGLVVVWDWARAGASPFIAAQLRGYGELRPAMFESWGRRLIAWLRLGHYWTGSIVLTGLIALVAATLVVRWLRRGRAGGPSPAGLLMAGWLACYGILHWLTNVPVWDRYLLPAVPVASIVAGWGVDSVLAGTGSLGRLLVIALVLALILIPAGRAAAGTLPLGGDHGLYDGIDQIAKFLADYPYGTVLYDHWLSWQLRYYLFDSRVYVSWFAGPSVLEEDLRAFGDRSPRFLVRPVWEDVAPVQAAVEEAGYQLAPAYTAHRPDGSTSFLVYRIAREDGG
jgi:4-amino-4-deoxy-L-arabinose transferase-like glycosyltransferase